MKQFSNFQWSFFKSSTIIVFSLILLSISACIVEPDDPPTDTYVFLVHRNNNKDLENIKIENYNDGTGFMETPEIIGEGYSRKFNLSIDKVNDNKWNFIATNTEQTSIMAEGSGFFGTDTIYAEFTYSYGGFDFVDIFTGTR